MHPAELSDLSGVLSGVGSRCWAKPVRPDTGQGMACQEACASGESKVGGREEERKVEAKEDAKHPPAHGQPQPSQ